jgi:16S rRNA U516 pseudouridylate synthase RsuA-like enzyme
VGFPVVSLMRVDFAGLTLEGLKPGEWRYLNKKEIERLRARVTAPPRSKAHA